jgi:hypothetical protein
MLTKLTKLFGPTTLVNTPNLRFNPPFLMAVLSRITSTIFPHIAFGFLQSNKIWKVFVLEYNFLQEYFYDIQDYHGLIF